MNRRTRPLVIKLTVLVIGMFGFGFAMVPLYSVLCKVTGLNGKTGGKVDVASLGLKEDPSRNVEVEFVTSLNSYMNWKFEPPQQPNIVVHPGKLYTVTFRAHNNTGENMIGQAVPSISPGLAASYFKKTECFCFTRQPFAAGEAKDMPVTFFVDPSLPRDVGHITLSYTFFDVTSSLKNDSRTAVN